MNIEKAIIDYLKPLMPDVKVSGDVPNPRPKLLVTVERTGGSSDSIVLDHPQIALQCWASTRYGASELAYRVDKAMKGFDGPEIAHIERSSLYNFPDDKGNPRYQITYEAVVYE